MYVYVYRARFHWWPASYQVFPSTNGPPAPAAGTHVGNRVNVRCPTTRNHFQRSIPDSLCTCSFSRPSSSNYTNSVFRLYVRIVYDCRKKPTIRETKRERALWQELSRCCRYCVNLNEFYCNIFQRIKEKRWLFSNGSTLSFISEEFLSLSQEVKLWRKREICRAGKFSKRVSI